MSYLGNVGHKLPGNNTSINQVQPQLMGPGNAQVRRPFPQFGNVTLDTPVWSNSTYHAMNVKLEKRFSHGLNLLANYTLSKFIDDVSSKYDLGQVGGSIQNYYDLRAEKSLAGNDVRHRFNWSSVFELPVGRGRHWLARGHASAVLGGWDLGAILTLRQGSPFELVTQTNTTNAFTPGSQRVNVIRNPALPGDQRRLDRWFDTTAVAVPPAFTFGNSSRAFDGSGTYRAGSFSPEGPSLEGTLERAIPVRVAGYNEPPQFSYPRKRPGIAQFRDHQFRADWPDPTTRDEAGVLIFVSSELVMADRGALSCR